MDDGCDGCFETRPKEAICHPTDSMDRKMMNACMIGMEVEHGWTRAQACKGNIDRFSNGMILGGIGRGIFYIMRSLILSLVEDQLLGILFVATKLMIHWKFREPEDPVCHVHRSEVNIYVYLSLQSSFKKTL